MKINTGNEIGLDFQAPLMASQIPFSIQMTTIQNKFELGTKSTHNIAPTMLIRIFSTMPCQLDGLIICNYYWALM